MEERKTVLDALEEIKEKELDFLPDDPAVKEGFMTFIKFFLLAS